MVAIAAISLREATRVRPTAAGAETLAALDGARTTDEEMLVTAAPTSTPPTTASPGPAAGSIDLSQLASEAVAEAEAAQATTTPTTTTKAKAVPKAAGARITTTTVKKTTATTVKPKVTTTTKPPVTTKPGVPAAATSAAPAPTTKNPDGTRSQTGTASWFSAPDASCAHNTIPKGTLVKVTRLSTGVTTTCTIDQGGPSDTTRIIDLSKDTFAKLADPGAGLIEVRIEW